MAKFKKSDFRPASDRIEKLPKARRERIERGAAEIVRAHHLAELRKAMDVTQMRVAEVAGMKQAEVSRIEKAPASVQLRTMERYVKALGGEMTIVARFPDGTLAEIPIHQGRPSRKRARTSTVDRQEKYAEEHHEA